jgi:tRNA threonylcarbamoyladenosine biosynthesis protein TsaE
MPVFHFDTYRLGGPNDFEALAASDYWGGEGVCLVEWADRVADRLPREAWMIRIEPTGSDRRRFMLRFPEGSRVVDRLAEGLARFGALGAKR